jgi:hypothetical protein
VPSDHGVTPVPPGCPRCGAHARRGAQWCTLCYADLRPAPPRSRRAEPVLETVPPTPTTAPTPAPTTAPVPVVVAGRGKHARPGSTVEATVPQHSGAEQSGAEQSGTEQSGAGSGPPARTADEEALRSADAMLALLALEQTPPLPGLSGRLDSKGARVALTVGGMALVGLFFFLVMALLGTIV